MQWEKRSLYASKQKTKARYNMTAKMEYADYLTRLARNSTKPASDWNKEKTTRGVGKSYGLSETEMDEVVG